MKKKVVFLIRDLEYGGAQRQLVTLVKGLDKQSFDVSVLHHYSNGPLEKDLKDANIETICLEKQGRWDLFGFFWHLVKHLKRIEPGILHGYLNDANLLTIFLKPFFPSTRMIWGIRDSNIDLNQYPYDWLLRLLSQLECFFSRFADLIIINSHAGQAAYVSQGFPADKTVVIPNGIDTERFKPDLEAKAKVRAEWGISENTILIGLVGRLDPMKDHPTFLKAAALLCEKIQNVRFVCVGSGPHSYAQKLYQLADELGISEKVIWVGARADMPAVHNSLNIATSSSCYGEGFANVIGEAMACGIPCVVTNVGDSRRIVGDTGLIIPPRDPQALFDAWLNILKMNTQELSMTARTRIQENFSTKVLSESTESVLNKK